MAKQIQTRVHTAASLILTLCDLRPPKINKSKKSIINTKIKNVAHIQGLAIDTISIYPAVYLCGILMIIKSLGGLFLFKYFLEGSWYLQDESIKAIPQI
jgi:hypothetical protein